MSILPSLSLAVCIGTNGRMSVPNNREHHYRNLRDRYTNCTYVDGNLELTWLQDESLDLGFLRHIREVTGYVLISHVDVARIVLPSLQIIRGRTLFKLNVQDDQFALMVTLSKMHNLEMPALRGKTDRESDNSLVISKKKSPSSFFLPLSLEWSESR